MFGGTVNHPFECDVGKPVVIGVVAAHIGMYASEPRFIDEPLIAEVLDEVLAVRSAFLVDRRNCQYLWIGVFQATSVPAC